MDPMPPFTIIPVLREAAELKIEELNRTKESFKRRYHLNANRSTEGDSLKRISGLLEDIRKLDPYLQKDDDLPIMARYIEQAQDDKSVSSSKLLKFEEQLWDKLNKHLNRMEISSLHVDLMKEVMETQPSADSIADKLEKASLDDDFEMVENELEEVLEEFEQDTFTAKDVDVEAIETYLSSLFVDDRDKRDLDDLRGDMRLYGDELMDNNGELDQDILMWNIMELLKNDLISPEKKKALEGYLQSPIALRELVATMKMKSFQNWDYNNSHDGLPVTARQNAEGQYCITVEEDIIDMLFLQCSAIGWASKLKECLKDFTRTSVSFSTKDLTVDELNQREYYLLAPRRANQTKPSACSVCHPYYPSAPMPPPPGIQLFPPPPPDVTYPVGKKAKKRRPFNMPPPPPPPPDFNCLKYERNTAYTKTFFMSRLPAQEGCTPKVTRPEDVQANLIETLAVETKLRKAFDGKAHALAVEFDSLASSLPHKTILTVLKFLGVPETFLEYFTCFLEARLNIGPAVRGTPDRILQRTCGVPIGHGMEMLFSEAVLFFLELSVHQKTGSYLYRLNDRCYFVGTYEQRTKAAEETESFAGLMGLKLKGLYPGGGKLVIGCLAMDTMSTSPAETASFAIDNSMVIAYAHRVKKELDACLAVLDWVRVWNSTAGTYASHLFGPLAAVFGKAHLEDVKSAYNRIFSIIFNGGDLTTHVKNLLNTHIKRGLSDPTFALEALIYLPQAYGGLGVKNPFITLNLAHNMSEDPNAEVDKYLKDEETYYDRAAEIHALLTAEQRQEKLEAIFGDNKDKLQASLGPDWNLATFMTREELVTHRELRQYPNLQTQHFPPPFTTSFPPSLVDLYQDLLHQPHDNIDVSEKVCDEIRRLSGTGDMKPWRKLSGEERWVLEMYGDECFEKYGTLEIWWGDGVPNEVYKAVRGHVWSDGDDDGSSYETLSEC
ncbi:uncharacterized protein K460DRAFT_366074 [Cucurbitaria berberidis CBS 394.84]|uniref:Reverse transcriptase domain-containing protein n=1 Tax=Cucurbitaria berberidis CBS 394.84 TaxID=1168544 RepID=A0A9P4GFN1_9PLEO|nr:uncharacterized protein K460DRAFT_366074 [Cucurbitaria berberidis CBS 394.84]KAF1845188.1 hypothetical protein K460DRAFT_366074 [Cucurbitaria berberidis CBS 394.84]